MTSRIALWALLTLMLAPLAEAGLLRRLRKPRPQPAIAYPPPVVARRSPCACGVRFDSTLVTSRLMEPEESLTWIIALPLRIR